MTASDHGGVDLGGGYAAQLEAIRSAAKWLMAASAGVGVLLAAGLQLTAFGSLPADSWRPYAALGAAALALSSAAYVINSASTVLTQEWLTLASFTDAAGGLPVPWQQRKPKSSVLRDIEDRLNASHQELFGHVASSVAELHANLRKCHDSMLYPGWRGRLSSRQAIANSRELRRAARDVVQVANYYHVLHLFHRLRVRMAWAAAAVVTGIVIFAYAVGQPGGEGPIEVARVSIPSVCPGAMAE